VLTAGRSPFPERLLSPSRRELAWSESSTAFDGELLGEENSENFGVSSSHLFISLKIRKMLLKRAERDCRKGIAKWLENMSRLCHESLITTITVPRRWGFWSYPFPPRAHAKYILCQTTLRMSIHNANCSDLRGRQE